MKLRYLLAVLCAGPLVAQAAIYKAVDENGHVTYSSTPIKGGKRIYLEPLPTVAPLAPRSSAEQSGSGFPRVDGETQRTRDDARRKILEDELAAEEKLLEEAKQDLKLAEETPEISRVGGKIHRNYAKYLENVKAAQDKVDLHQKNVEALKTELSKLK